MIHDNRYRNNDTDDDQLYELIKDWYPIEVCDNFDLLIGDMSEDTLNEMCDWCHDNCEYDWSTFWDQQKYYSYVFKSQEDAALFSLTWL